MPLTQGEVLSELADAYAQACAEIQPKWLAVLRAGVSSPERDQRIREYNDGRRKVDETKSALLTYARRGHSEVGQ